MKGSAAREDYLVIGWITRPHGVRGEVKVRPETDFPERFQRLRRVLVVREGQVREMDVEGVRWQGAQALLKLAGVTDADAARALAGAAVAVPWEERVKLPDGAYYVFQILGLTVRTVAGEELGKVTEVMRAPSNDVYRVEGADGVLLIPATRGVIRAVRLTSGEMLVDLPAGLR